MISDFKLKADESRRAYDLETMNFESTEDLDPLKGIIGQQRGWKLLILA